MLKKLAVAAGAIAFVAVCLLAPIAYAAAAVATPSDAPASTHVIVPWGEWVAGWIGSITVDGVIGWATWLATRLGVPWVKNILINDAVERAIGSGIATVKGAVGTETLDVKVANDVAAAALSYLVSHEPVIAKWLGDTIGPRILAQLGAMRLAPAEALAPPAA
jgi:hypothetical protein